jgi:glycosyltransferase involved in cell wall biosynthesis
MTTGRLTLPRSIALVQDALPCRGGAERVLETVLDSFPDAPIHTLVFNREAFRGTPLADHEVRTSFIDRLPGAHRAHRLFLPLFPSAIERFDLGRYQVIVSFSYAVAHGVLPRPDQLHVSYTYTPLRHAWHFYHEYVRSIPQPARWIARPLLHYLRLWDTAAAARVDRFVAISKWVAACIWRAYRRHARVLYPPVDLEAFSPLSNRDRYYVSVGRLVPHKRLDVLIDAFSRLGRQLLVVGQGSERERLMARAASNVEFLGHVPDAQLAELLGRARAVVHAAEEDFGIALVEAQAAGCPVLAYSSGGAGEIVADGRTGVLFHRQTPEAVMEAVDVFEAAGPFSEHECRRNAMRFSKERFKRGFARILEQEWETFHRRTTASRTPDAGGAPPALRERAADVR